MAAENDYSTDRERQSDLAVMDKNEYKQKRRLERILDAHDKVEEKANEAWERFVNGDISHDGKNIMIQRAVKGAIREVYNLLLDHQFNSEDHSQFWMGFTTEAEAKSGDASPIGVIKMAQQDDIPVWGLRDFLRTKELYHESWTETDTRRNKPPKTVHYEQKHSVPERVSWGAYLHLKQFLNEQYDLDLQFDDDSSEIIRNFDQSGDAPRADFDQVAYNGDPDL